MASDSEDLSLDLDSSTVERFEKARERTKNAHVPEMSQDAFLNALLDTDEAVREGHYSEGDDE